MQLLGIATLHLLFTSLEITVCGDEPLTVGGFACFGKIMGMFASAFVTITVFLVAKSILNSEPEMPAGFVSNTTIVIARLLVKS